MQLQPGQPFFFGPPEKQLFGCYQPASGNITRDCAVLICYPIGHEYIRSHRTFRNLASRLNQEGFPVLRFDYYGSGDSAGDSENARLEDWSENIGEAIRQLRGRSRLLKVCVIGMRVGASLAMQVGAERGDIEALVLWDAVVRGQNWLDEAAEAHAALELEIREKWGREQVSANGSQNGHSTTHPGEFLGFAYQAAMLQDLARLNLNDAQESPAQRVLLLDNIEESCASPLRENLERSGTQLDCVRLQEVRAWQAEPYKGLVPHQTLQAILTWMTGVAS